jgi:hypothetical protein
MSIIYDMKVAGQIALQSRFGGVEVEREWGKQVPTWWSYEMFNTMQRMTMEKEQNIVRMKVTFERVMVNATLKSVERMGRDLAQMQGSLEEKLDPRLVDERMKSQRPDHYWNNDHRWGPNWPIPEPSTNGLTSAIGSPAEPVQSPPSVQPL